MMAGRARSNAMKKMVVGDEERELQIFANCTIRTCCFSLTVGSGLWSSAISIGLDVRTPACLLPRIV